MRVYAGPDPVTGRDRYLTQSVKGTDRAARKLAEKALTRLQAEVDKQRVPETAARLAHALDEWLRTAEIEETTRRTYVGYIERLIKPALGSISIAELSARNLETLYAELRRCRTRCDGRPFIERHRTTGEHDCVASQCVPHACKPMAASTVRQIHSIISGTLSAAVRWGWIASDPARIAQRPRVKAPEPSPPSPAEAARLLDAAFAMDDDWGALVWLVMTTGIRRGEVCALRWRDFDLDGETIEIRRNYVLHKGVVGEVRAARRPVSSSIGLVFEQCGADAEDDPTDQLAAGRPCADHLSDVDDGGEAGRLSSSYRAAWATRSPKWADAADETGGGRAAR